MPSDSMERLTTPEVRHSLDAVIEYLWRDELKNWDEDGHPKEGHVFCHVRRVAAWLDEAAEV